jgi:hypothetical protein
MQFRHTFALSRPLRYCLSGICPSAHDVAEGVYGGSKLPRRCALHMRSTATVSRFRVRSPLSAMRASPPLLNMPFPLFAVSYPLFCRWTFNRRLIACSPPALSVGVAPMSSVVSPPGFCYNNILEDQPRWDCIVIYSICWKDIIYLEGYIQNS